MKNALSTKELIAIATKGDIDPNKINDAPSIST